MAGAGALTVASAVLPSARVTVRVAVSAPAGNAVTVAPAKLKFSNVSGVSSDTTSSLTAAELDDWFLTLRVMVLASALPATAEPSAQSLVTVGLTTRGTLIVTSTEASSGGALLASLVAVFVTTVPDGTVVSGGTVTGMLICGATVPAGHPVVPSGLVRARP